MYIADELLVKIRFTEKTRKPPEGSEDTSLLKIMLVLKAYSGEKKPPSSIYQTNNQSTTKTQCLYLNFIYMQLK